MVMLLPYQNQPRIGWKPSGNRYNGTYGLQVWKVAQLVERWTFNLHVSGSIPGFPICRERIITQLTVANTFST